ncbi:hypothetical protein [Corynebacterium frankenforstense]
MTMMMTAPSTCRHRPADAPVPLVHAVLRIAGMPVRLRRDVEALMVEHLPTGGSWVAPGTDPLEADWCTDWRREGAGRTGCRQVLTAPAAELRAFGRALRELAEATSFDATLTRAR